MQKRGGGKQNKKKKKTHKRIVEGPWRNITDETIVKISRYSVLALGDPMLLWWGRKKGRRGRKTDEKKEGWLATYLCAAGCLRRRVWR